MTYTIYQKQFRAISGNNCHYGRITDNDVTADNKTFSWVYDCGQTDFISQMPDNGKVDLSDAAKIMFVACLSHFFLFTFLPVLFVKNVNECSGINGNI